MQTLLISKRVLGQLPARTKIYEKQKQPKDQKATSQPRRPYVVFLVYFPANPSVYVSQSSSDSWTHWSNTNKSGRDVEVTDLWWCKRFHGNGKKTQTRVPTKKDCPEAGCTAWPLLGQAAHVMLQTSRWDSWPSCKDMGNKPLLVLLLPGQLLEQHEMLLVPMLFRGTCLLTRDF